MTFAVESLASQIGVVSPSLTDAKIRKIGRWPATERGRIRRWLRGDDESPEYEPPPERDLERTRAQLKRVLTETELFGVVEGLPGMQATELIAVINNARRNLYASYPLIEVQSVLGAEPIPPSFDDEEAWLDQVAVDEDPGRLVDEMLMGSLETTQVEAFRRDFPALWQALWNVVTAELMEMRDAKITEIQPDREAMCRVLGMLPFEQPVIPSVPKPIPPTTTTKQDLMLKAQQSPAERVANPLGET